MPRPLRVQFPGAIYRLMNRGANRSSRMTTIAGASWPLLGEACDKTGWQLHAYCLMGNHFHLVVETPRANLVAGMQWFLGASPPASIGASTVAQVLRRNY